MAVSGFDLEVGQGEIVGLLGPNGAGKTTLVKMLSGILRPSSGMLRVFGHDPHARQQDFLDRISLVMGQKSQLWWDLPAMDSFRLAKAIYGLSETKFRASLKRLALALDAEDLFDRQVRKLSLGERMRMEFIVAMLHEPELVFLDEPTIGLDAPAQRRIRDFLAQENSQRGTTIVLTSHYMDDIRKLCPRSVLISGGRKCWDGSTEEMLESARHQADEDIADTVERLYEEAEIRDGGMDE